MRLNCPNCAAAYEVPDGMVPAAGRHVQCTVCHTRWFVAGAPRKPMSEERILARLDTLSNRPRPLAVVTPPKTPAEQAEADVEVESPPKPVEPKPAEPAPPPRMAAPAKPGDKPAVARPAEAPPSPPRSGLRLEVANDAAPPPEPAAGGSRFGIGLLVALLLAALALGTYHWRGAIAARLPEAAPTMAAYGVIVDDLRATVEAQLEPLRDALDAAGKPTP